MKDLFKTYALPATLATLGMLAAGMAVKRGGILGTGAKIVGAGVGLFAASKIA